MIINNSGDDNNSTFSNKLQTNRIEKAGLKNMPPDSNPLYRRRLKPIYEASDISPSESKSIINIVPVSLEKGYEGGSRRKVNINELRMQGRVPGIAAQPENEVRPITNNSILASRIFEVTLDIFNNLLIIVRNTEHPDLQKFINWRNLMSSSKSKTSRSSSTPIY